jgi:4-amino-4-deoxy-L-arabinose transferase
MSGLNKEPPMPKKRRYALLVLSFFLVSYILPLGSRHLFVPDETRYAEVPREMIAGGDWVSPHLNGVRYFEKPVLGYWLHAGSILLFGENNFAVRFPSAVSAGLSALLIYVLIVRMYRKGEESILAALIFLSCFEVIGVGTTALLDSVFSFFLTATIIVFYFATEAPPGSAGEKRLLALCGFACGLAFLTKGFLAVAVPAMAAAPYLFWQRRYRDLLRMGWLPLLTAVLVVLPWSVFIHMREPDFWRFFFWNEHIRRFVADDAQHHASFWFFFMAAPALFMSWTFLAPAAAAGVPEQTGGRSPRGRLIRFSICWLVLPFLFFSFSRGKIVTYILPCFPPFAVLMAFGLSRKLEKGKSRAFQFGVAGAGIFCGLILLALIYLQVFGYDGFRVYGRSWRTLLAVSGLVLYVLMCFWAFKSRRGGDKAILFGLAPVLLFFAAPFITPDRAIEKKAPEALLERHRQGIAQDDFILSDEDTVTAVCWYLKRSDVYVLGYAGELEYGLAYEDAAARRLDMKSAVHLIESNPGKIVLVARAKNIREWQDQLPKPLSQDDNGPEGYVISRY